MNSNLQDFKKALSNKGALLALDVSKKRLGLAISNAERTLAMPLKVITRKKLALDLQELSRLYKDYTCTGLVVGYPIFEGSDKNPACQAIRAFTRNLLEVVSAPLWLENEEYSTLAAQEFTQGLKNSKKEDLDDHAAAYFLQRCLDKLRRM